MHIINGLHEFLNDDAEFVAAALLAGVTITDVRRPRTRRTCSLFSGRIFDVTCPRIAVLGTDGAIGKRTTATLLVQALNARGIKAVMVGTGQTTLIQGGKYGVALDAIARSSAPARSSTGRRGLRGRGPRRDHRRGPGRAQPPGLPDVGLHPARQPTRRRDRAARTRSARCSATSR